MGLKAHALQKQLMSFIFKQLWRESANLLANGSFHMIDGSAVGCS
jgi:hypothetical protein